MTELSKQTVTNQLFEVDFYFSAMTSWRLGYLGTLRKVSRFQKGRTDPVTIVTLFNIALDMVLIWFPEGSSFDTVGPNDIINS